ncbi:MAG: tetratricopeptide repeat protein [Limisphaerales bacterium]
MKRSKAPLLWTALVSALLLVLLLWRWQTSSDTRQQEFAEIDVSAVVSSQSQPSANPLFRFRRGTGAGAVEADVEDPAERVQRKLDQFLISRLDLARALAAHKQVTLPPVVEEFFTALRSDWERATALLTAWKENGGLPAETREFGGVLLHPLIEAYGVAEVARRWPADRLVQYGETLMGALPPGAVYVGGTDAGRFIPLLLGDSDRIMLTQNQLADGHYLEYVRYQFDGRLQSLSLNDSAALSSAYLADAQERLRHDQQNPDAPPRIRSGEVVRAVGNSIQVGGAGAVMTLNEMALVALMDKNPGLTFVMEESWSLPGTYAGATLAGPLIQLRTEDGGQRLSAEQAGAAVDYWRTAQADLVSEAWDSPVRQSWGQLAVAQANLLSHHGLGSEAEQIYRLAYELAPANAHVVEAYAGFLKKTGKPSEAQKLLATLPAAIRP